MFQNCLICTDLSDGLQRLVNFVPSFAAAGVKKLVFLHSVPLWEEGEVPRVDEEKLQQAKDKLQPALENCPEGIEVRVETPSGKPLDTIPRILQNDSFDVIITGTTRRSLLEEKFVGSTSVGLGKQTEIPLMILRPQLVSTYTEEELDLRCRHLWRYLLLPYNDSEAARYLVERIKNYATQPDGNSLKECLLMWVVDDSIRRGMPIEYRLEEAQEKIQPAKRELESVGLTVHTEVRQGNPLLEVLAAAQTYDISAIAIGADYRASILEWTVPSFANEVFRRSWFPVLFFSPKK
jgi:nucleotide-binding universal stress UspA family protein